ncbi:MAG: TSUP family transporter [Bacteroidota bacterium]
MRILQRTSRFFGYDDMEDWALLVGLALVAGMVGGLCGVGGGGSYVPVLGWWLDRQGFAAEHRVSMVLGNSLAMTLVTSLVGVWLWKRKGVYEPRTWLNMGVPAGLIAVGLAWLLRQGAFYDAALVRVVFSSMLAMMLARNAWAWFKVGAVTSECHDKEPIPLDPSLHRTRWTTMP